MLTKPFKPLALAFLVNLIISVEDKIKYKVTTARHLGFSNFHNFFIHTWKLKIVRKYHLAIGIYKIVRFTVKLSVFRQFFSENSYFFGETFVVNTQVA